MGGRKEEWEGNTITFEIVAKKKVVSAMWVNLYVKLLIFSFIIPQIVIQWTNGYQRILVVC